MDEVDITDHLPAGFFQTIRSAKWTERRDVMLALIDTLSQHPHINPKIKYNEIFAEFKLIITKDSNIVVVTLALRAITAFVKGLRKNFVKYIPMAPEFSNKLWILKILVQILEKFKEKKASVKEAVVECLSVVAEHCDSTILIGPICEALEKATNPNVKASIDQWIYCILCHCPRNAASISFIKSIGQYLAKHSNDSDPDVREASYMVFGAILRLVEEKVIASIVDGVFSDKTKSKKITEYLEKAEKDFEAYEQERIKNDIALESCILNENMEHYGESSNGLIQPDAAISSWELLTETKIGDKIPHDILTKLASKKWSDRKETLEILYSILENSPRLCPDEDHSELIGTLCKMLEKDVNINVAAIAAKCITSFANGLRYRFAMYIPKIYVSAFEKFKEKKLVLREPLIELCDVLALLTPLSAYIDDVEIALQKSNPQIKTQTALFVSRLLRQHSADTLPLDCIRQKLGPALSKLSFDADPESREASFVAIGAIMRIVGENAINIYCSEIMEDDIKSAKVREKCESLIKDFGLNASAPILKLYQKTKSTVAITKAGNNKAASVGAKKKDSKNNVKITKKVPYDATVPKSKFNSTIVPAARIQSVRLASASAANVSMKIPATYETRIYENNSNENDVFFDAAEEIEVASHSSSDPDDSSKRNRTFIVEEKEPEIGTTEKSVPLQSASREMKRSDTANFTVSSVSDFVLQFNFNFFV
uniref:TOG domain-containing protein n=1 Tax=Onchocerca volvulus TaxID=6282 RepID=A0A8R1TIQ7_ONCVO